MRHPVLSLVIALGLSAIACSEQTTEVRQDPVAPPLSAVTAATCTMADIKSQIDALFPAGALRNSAQSQFKSIPPKTTKPTGNAARDKTFKLIGFILTNYFAGKLVGTDIPAQVLALINALNCFAGLPALTIPAGALDPAGDGAAAIITPTSPTTEVVNGNRHAGLRLLTGSVSRPVLVSISRLPDSPGPLLTNLDQYPLFYEFSVSPNVTFNLDVLGGICLRDNVANAATLRLAHNVGISFGDVEILPSASPDFLDCSSLDNIGSSGRTGWNRFAWAKALLLPAELHATTTALATVGVGGTTRKFTPFGAVDPGSNNGEILFNPDAATFDNLTAAPGGTVSPAPSVKVTSQNDSAIANVPVVFAVTGGGGTINDGATSVTVTTGADGIASLDDWTLGSEEGTNTLTATPPVGAQVGSPPAAYKPAVGFDPSALTFTAEAETEGESGFAAVSAGAFHSCGVSTDGTAYCWGRNLDGELGNGTNTNSSVPVAVSGSHTFASVSAGIYYNCGVTTAGAAYCWGNNNLGQLGNGTITASNVPVLVLGTLTFASVNAGNSHSCGVTTDEVAYCWGYNGPGTLGNGTTTNSAVPVAVSGEHTFASVNAGNLHSCGVTTGEAAYCWGDNANGQLGDNTNTNSAVPVAVAGEHTFASVSASDIGFHSCGVTTGEAGEAAYCWGGNTNGQLGDGTNTSSNLPVAVSGSPTLGSTSAGALHSCGVAGAGSAYCWGYNFTGALGNGTNTDTNVPVAVSGSYAFAAVSAGQYHTCGVTAAGAAYCWGHNAFGGLGNGTTTPSNVPVAVSLP